MVYFPSFDIFYSLVFCLACARGGGAALKLFFQFFFIQNSALLSLYKIASDSVYDMNN